MECATVPSYRRIRLDHPRGTPVPVVVLTVIKVRSVQSSWTNRRFHRSAAGVSSFSPPVSPSSPGAALKTTEDIIKRLTRFLRTRANTMEQLRQLSSLRSALFIPLAEGTVHRHPLFFYLHIGRESRASLPRAPSSRRVRRNASEDHRILVA